MVYEMAENWHDAGFYEHVSINWHDAGFYEHSCHFWWMLFPLALLVKGFSLLGPVQFSVCMFYVCALRSTTMSSVVFSHIELYMVLLAPFDYIAHYSLIILSHTPKYGNQQKTSQDAKMLFQYFKSVVRAEEGGRQVSPLQPLLTTMCDTVLQVHCGLPVMLFTIQDRRGHLHALLSASHLVKLN